MKKIPLFLLLLSAGGIISTLTPNPVVAEVNVNIGINVPLPGFVFPGPPAVALIPGTYVYAVPDVEIDILFFRGRWYRSHGNRWYRSASYNRPWGHIDRHRVPSVIVGLPPDYRHISHGHSRIPYGHLKKNWKEWEKRRYWDTHEYRHEQWERQSEKNGKHHRKHPAEHPHKGDDRHHHKGKNG